MKNLYAKMTGERANTFSLIRANILNEMYETEQKLGLFKFAYECNNGNITTSVLEFKGGEI